jgi:hypothetical protein
VDKSLGGCFDGCSFFKFEPSVKVMLGLVIAV